jgi:hypothetical protein
MAYVEIFIFIAILAATFSKYPDIIYMHVIRSLIRLVVLFYLGKQNLTNEIVYHAVLYSM